MLPSYSRLFIVICNYATKVIVILFLFSMNRLVVVVVVVVVEPLATFLLGCSRDTSLGFALCLRMLLRSCGIVFSLSSELTLSWHSFSLDVVFIVRLFIHRIGSFTSWQRVLSIALSVLLLSCTRSHFFCLFISVVSLFTLVLSAHVNLVGYSSSSLWYVCWFFCFFFFSHSTWTDYIVDFLPHPFFSLVMNSRLVSPF